MPRRALLLITLVLGLTGRAHGQCPDGTPSPCRTGPAPASNSVAVLVFENRARDTSLALLAEGLADEITTNLGRIARLDVRSPASVRVVLANGTREPRRVGRALGVRYLVDGALLPSRGNVRVSVDLVDVTRRGLRWTAVYQRPTDDLFGLITTIADSIAAGIVGELAPTEHAARPRAPRSPLGYQAYVSGIAALHHLDVSGLRQAITFLDEATRLDSAFADAWAALAEAWMWSDGSQPARVVYPRARAAAQRALTLDPSNGVALAALGGIAYYHDWDLARAEQLARRALDVSPTLARARLYLGEAMALQGHATEALAELRLAVAADTLDEPVAGDASWAFFLLSDTSDLALTTNRWRKLAPRSGWPVTFQLWPLLARGACLPKDVPPGEWDNRGTQIAVRYCREGQSAARALQDSIVESATGRGEFLRADHMAHVYALVGDSAAALEWFARAVDDREAAVMVVPLLPWWKHLRGSSRFLELWHRTGQPLPAVN